MSPKELARQILPPLLFGELMNALYFLEFQKYRKLIQKNSQLKNTETGRCFIIGSGPSIKNIDLRLLENEKVMALNNFYVHPLYEFIKPQYYVVAPLHQPQTDEEWLAWFKDMDANLCANTILFLGLSHRGLLKQKNPSAYEIVNQNDELFKKIDVNYYFSGDFCNRSLDKFIDLETPLFTSFTCSLMAIVIALYLGFKQIYLLGMDSNHFMFDQESERRFYTNGIHQKNEIQRVWGDRYYVECFKAIYEIFKKYYDLNKIAEKKGIKIINATDNTVLKIFDCVEFESLF
ncbi:DUF115 domain-containing protein [Microcoleus sp. FACHB-672]|uniref:DUF115 domain-containing protein n=1 Tax=Microcoleus sp. FACHB-672 TaxID=2692825 RepID=UPI0016858437|nr:DUF115 domain-containing protein [Microcoleus sp. FACHB-672]MBD2039809.1 DUF115 domain-containing protein [Microcoleus sp. FACHB-672]